jgi:N-acetylmuramoyl-L-alanine amidase
MSSTPPLRFGAAGPAVRAVRERLVATGDLPASAARDVEFDHDVQRAVRAFQQRRGLLVDGVVGTQTFRSLDGARWLLGDRILVHSPAHQVSGDDVAALQERLLSLGFPSGRVDGRFGPQTERAVREFQQAVGLRPDGLVGPHTLRALGQLARSVRGGAPHRLREADVVRSAGPNLRGRVVVLDPGSGSGGHLHGLSEAEITLDVARRVEGRLAAVGVQVALTRAPGTDPSTSDRVEVANAMAADLLVSLRCESLPQAPQAQGVASFFYGHPEHREAWSGTGERLASFVQREIVARTDLVDCRSHARTWELLQRSVMPAVRIEVGHLSHPGDAARLADPAFRDTLAESVVVGVQRLYLDDVDDATTGTLNVADVLARSLQV